MEGEGLGLEVSTINKSLGDGLPVPESADAFNQVAAGIVGRVD